VIAATVLVLAAQPATAGADDHLMRVKEIAVSQGADATRQFVELQDSSNEGFPSPPYKLVVYDEDGVELGEQTLANTTVGATPNETNPILLASAAWSGANPTPTANEALTVTLPQDAGQVCFTRGPAETRIDCMTYGCIASELNSESGGANGAAPPDGKSAQRQASNTVTLDTPTPKAANETDGELAGACPTPPAAPTIVTGPGQNEEIHNDQAHFYWVGAEAGGTFECSENAGPFDPCDAPQTMGLTPDNTSQSFAIRQVDDEQTAGTPVTVSFFVNTQGEAADITILDDAYLPDGTAESGATRKPLGSPFNWKWGSDGAGTGDSHNVRQNKNLFASGDDTTSSSPFSTTPSAGRFPYHCTIHGNVNPPSGSNMAGIVEVIPIRDTVSEPTGLPFRVAWDDPSTSTTANKFDVRYRVNGGSYKTWREDTRAAGAVFGNNNKPVRVRESKLYEFQVRSQRGKRKRSGFSPPLPIRP
jgi:hypothetical protein